MPGFKSNDFGATKSGTVSAAKSTPSNAAATPQVVTPAPTPVAGQVLRQRSAGSTQPSLGTLVPTVSGAAQRAPVPSSTFNVGHVDAGAFGRGGDSAVSASVAAEPPAPPAAPTSPQAVVQSAAVLTHPAAIVPTNAGVLTKVSTVVTDLLNPFASTSNTPLPGKIPATWTLLAFAGRELEQTVANVAPTLNPAAGAISNSLVTGTPVVSSQTVNPVISAIGAVVSSVISGIDAVTGSIAGLLGGISPPPSTPGTFVIFSGAPSLVYRLAVIGLDLAKPIENLLGVSFMTTFAPLIASTSPPAFLTTGLTVTSTTFDGMQVWDLTPPDPSGKYVVAIHGGAWIDQPTVFHWLAYTQMADETGATVIVPIYPLATQGGYRLGRGARDGRPHLLGDRLGRSRQCQCVRRLSRRHDRFSGRGAAS